jgi:hypothetical protein
MESVALRPASLDDLFEISLASSRSTTREVMIFERGDLSQIIGAKKAEIVRQSFLEHGTKVQQITDVPILPAFTANDRFVNECMTFRYIPKQIYTIGHEILIFDDIVAIYQINPEPQLLVIKDAAYALSQKQLFSNLWREGRPPVLGFSYKPNHSFYNSIDFTINGVPVILWPDADAKGAYGDMNQEALGEYLKGIFDSNADFFGKAHYVIGCIWNYQGDKMVDLWRFNSNFVDDRSGPLSEAKVFRNQRECADLGLASGNTLLVLGMEEKLRRQAPSLKDYLGGEPPHLPLEILNGKDFF